MSPIDSPRESCSSSPRRTIGVAPSSATPTSKEIRVRVEGCSKTSATLRPASASAPTPLARGRLSARRARSSSLPSSKAPSSSPVRKSALRQAADTTARGVHAPSPGTSSTGATSRPTRRCCTWRSRLLRVDERNETHVQVNRDLTARVRDACSPAPSGTSRCCRSARRASPSRWPRACGAEAHRVLTSRNSLGAAARAAGPPQPGPDRLRRGRLEPDPGARRRAARRDRRAARAGDPRGRARAPGDGA